MKLRLIYPLSIGLMLSTFPVRGGVDLAFELPARAEVFNIADDGDVRTVTHGDILFILDRNTGKFTITKNGVEEYQSGTIATSMSEDLNKLIVTMTLQQGANIVTFDTTIEKLPEFTNEILVSTFVNGANSVVDVLDAETWEAVETYDDLISATAGDAVRPLTLRSNV